MLPQSEIEDKPLTSREVMEIMNSQIQNIRNEFIGVLQSISNRIETTKTENTYFQTMEKIMNDGSLEKAQPQVLSSNQNPTRDISESLVKDVTDYNYSSQNQSSRIERSQSALTISDIIFDKKQNRRKSQNLRGSLDYTDSKTEIGMEKSHSDSRMGNRNLDYLQKIVDVGKENVGTNYESSLNIKFSQKEQKQPCPD